MADLIRIMLAGKEVQVNRRTDIHIPLGDSDEPPTEFCLFEKGTTETENGPYTFDKNSAKSVMQIYKEQGVDMAGDFHHASLDPHPLDPALACRASAYHDLEVRDGALWATNIRWGKTALELF